MDTDKHGWKLNFNREIREPCENGTGRQTVDFSDHPELSVGFTAVSSLRSATSERSEHLPLQGNPNLRASASLKLCRSDR